MSAADAAWSLFIRRPSQLPIEIARAETNDAPPLPSIVELVGESQLTLTLYNDDADESVRSDVKSYFDVQSVELYGFWTFDASIVDTILDRVGEFPVTEPSTFEYTD